MVRNVSLSYYYFREGTLSRLTTRESGPPLDPDYCYLAREAVLRGVLVEALRPAQETPEMPSASINVLRGGGTDTLARGN